MPLDPCGHIVDYVRGRPVDYIRPFADSDLTVRREWYPAAPNARHLPFPTVFFSAISQPTPWRNRGAGPVWPVVPRWTRRGVLPGLPVDHICGTPADFAGRALLSAVVAPIQRDRDGIPLCCGRLAPVVGLELGLEAVPTQEHHSPAPLGLELALQAVPTQEHHSPAPLGLELALQAVPVYTPATVDVPCYPVPVPRRLRVEAIAATGALTSWIGTSFVAVYDEVGIWTAGDIPDPIAPTTWGPYSARLACDGGDLRYDLDDGGGGSIAAFKLPDTGIPCEMDGAPSGTFIPPYPGDPGDTITWRFSQAE